MSLFYRHVIGEDGVSNAHSGFVRFYAGFSGKSARLGSAYILTARLPYALSVAMLGLASFSCGSSHAILEISAPSSVVAGSPFTATVTAVYGGKRDTIINGPIHFTSSDKAAALPTLYIFTAADAGSHTFTGLTLVTPGNQTMTVADYDATPIAGTVNIMVSAATADSQFKVGAPSTETAVSAFNTTVSAGDAQRKYSDRLHRDSSLHKFGDSEGCSGPTTPLPRRIMARPAPSLAGNAHAVVVPKMTAVWPMLRELNQGSTMFARRGRSGILGKRVPAGVRVTPPTNASRSSYGGRWL
jgi:hypothetical protein